MVLRKAGIVLVTASCTALQGCQRGHRTPSAAATASKFQPAGVPFKAATSRHEWPRRRRYPPFYGGGLETTRGHPDQLPALALPLLVVPDRYLAAQVGGQLGGQLAGGGWPQGPRHVDGGINLPSPNQSFRKRERAILCDNRVRDFDSDLPWWLLFQH